MPNNSPSSADKSSPYVESTIPVLAVADVPASIRFYRDVLGFKLDWGGEGRESHIASVSRDGHPIMLQRRNPAGPGLVWIGGTMLLSLWAKIKSDPSMKFLQPPTNQYWGLEMRIKDPDENVLWFGTDTLKDVPLGSLVPEEIMENLSRSQM